VNVRTAPFFLVALAVAFAAVAGNAANGATEDPAGLFIAGLANETIDTLSNESLSLPEREQALGRVFDRGFDVPTIGRFVVGRHWRTASKAQRKEYVGVFRDFIVKIYSRRFGSFSGERLEVTGVRAEDDRVSVVTSKLASRGSRPTRIVWRVRRNSDKFRVVDVNVEGVSMLITQRDEFLSVIRRKGNGIAGLIVILRDKTAALD
jgi:phospholipid transport system substrate-binding protein